jgi:hypothetical protein
VTPHVPVDNVLLDPVAALLHRGEVEDCRAVAARRDIVVVRGVPLQARQCRVVEIVDPLSVKPCLLNKRQTIWVVVWV